MDPQPIWLNLSSSGIRYIQPSPPPSKLVLFPTSNDLQVLITILPIVPRSKITTEDDVVRPKRGDREGLLPARTPHLFHDQRKSHGCDSGGHSLGSIITSSPMHSRLQFCTFPLSWLLGVCPCFSSFNTPLKVFLYKSFG